MDKPSLPSGTRDFSPAVVARRRFITGAIESDADTLEQIIQEVASTRMTERGNRADDKRSETSMEDRKRQGYF